MRYFENFVVKEIKNWCKVCKTEGFNFSVSWIFFGPVLILINSNFVILKDILETLYLCSEFNICNRNDGIILEIKIV